MNVCALGKSWLFYQASSETRPILQKSKSVSFGDRDARKSFKKAVRASNWQSYKNKSFQDPRYVQKGEWCWVGYIRGRHHFPSRVVFRHCESAVTADPPLPDSGVPRAGRPGLGAGGRAGGPRHQPRHPQVQVRVLGFRTPEGLRKLTPHQGTEPFQTWHVIVTAVCRRSTTGSRRASTGSKRWSC